MAIIPYKAEGIFPDVATHLLEISDHSLQARSMLTALGDYWTAYYRDLVPVSLAASGSMAAVSKEYTRLLDLVRASNILDVPITDASQLELLVIDAADLRRYTRTSTGRRWPATRSISRASSTRPF